MGPFQEYYTPTEEEIEEAKAAFEKERMRIDDLNARIRRMIAEDLTYEQLYALHAVFMHVANCQDPATLARWYEGIANGALAVRDLVLGEDEDGISSR